MFKQLGPARRQWGGKTSENNVGVSETQHIQHCLAYGDLVPLSPKLLPPQLQPQASAEDAEGAVAFGIL